jgi:very-short-patch-repair endonuclease
VDVLVLRKRRSRPGIRVHRSRHIATDDVTTHEGLPLTTPTRTLRELAYVLTPHRLERTLHNAAHRGLLDAPALATNARLAAALTSLDPAEPDITRTELEEAFLHLVNEAGLPRPLVNHPLHGYEVDFLWPELRLIVETDGRGTHLTPAAFEEDRQRDAYMATLGYLTLRFTYRQVVERPAYVKRTLTAAIAAR